MSTDRDYPETAAARGRVEPAPRRVRGFLGHELVFDTTAASYVWEVPYYPQYYIPLADVRMEFLRDENHSQKVQFGPSRLHSVVGTGHAYKSAARVFDADDDGPSPGPSDSSGTSCGGSRKTSPSTGTHAIRIRGSMRSAPTGTSGWNSMASC